MVVFVMNEFIKYSINDSRSENAFTCEATSTW